MELHKLLETLKKKMPFKPHTSSGDIILVGMKEGVFYGVVQSIDKNVKKNWFNLNFKLLVIPPVDVTWILRTPQMNGEIFFMDEEEHFVIALNTGRSNEKPKKPLLKLVENEPDNKS
jgi:hypothetical protein